VENTALDNVQIGAATPEPATGAVVIAGLALAAGLLRRRPRP